MHDALLLLLLLIANGSPIAARAVLRAHGATPLDGGIVLRDGQRLLGPSKTVRGVIVAVVASTLTAPLLGFDWWIGTTVGALAMLGDSLSSLVKRRLHLAAGASAPGLDHIPESLLPLLACSWLLDLSLALAVGLSVAFMLADLALSRWLYRLGIGGHPH
ncbi:MAG: CDP-archaeol synthase [Gammaproteobacteria bacterium]|nr:CDP-archaeol synthase [Gammaproteobacteria bacterium]